MRFYSYSIEDALEQAKKYFNCDENALSVKEIKAPSHKFFKLFNIKGEYEIELKENNTENDADTNDMEDLDGYIEVINGKIKVTNPEPGGKFPVISVYNNAVELLVNGNKIEKETELKAEDNIEISFHNEEPSFEIKAWLSADKLKAYLKISKFPGKDFFLKDTKPTKRLVIQPDYMERDPEPPTLDQCIEELRKIGVIPRFIKYDNIKSLLQQTEGETIAAEGEPPVHGTDSKIEYFFQNENYRNPDFDTDKKINLLDHTIIPHVREGDVLAVKKQQATPGKDGVAVNGSTIKAKNGIDLPLKGGNGVVVEGNKIISQINGRPSLKFGVVSVVPTLVVSNNVSVETGNINFDGDIVIKGNVEENLCVRVTGNIQITGNIYHASIYAGGNIEIKGHVINSRISAGTSMVRHLLINPILKQLLGIIKSMKDSVEDLMGSQPFVNVRYHVRKLVVQNKNQIEYIINEIENKKKFMDADESMEIDSLIKSMKTILTGINARCIENFESMDELLEEIKKYVWAADKNLLAENKVILRYAQNSFVQANGKIIVLDRGSFQSTLIARDAIEFLNSTSIVRGGYLLAGKSIKMKNVGTASGATTHCRVIDKNGVINADKFSNVLLDIGGNIQNIK